MRESELPLRNSLFAPGLHPIAILVEFRDARIDVSVRDVDVAVGIPSHISGLAKHSVYRRERRIGVLPRFGSLVGRFRPASEDPDYPARWIELDNHVGALVDGPDVVVLVDAHGVGLGPGVEAFPDFAYELAFGTEFEQLRRRAAIGRTVGAVRTREHEDVALGINGHARNLAKIHARRQRGKIRNGFELNFRHILLGVHGCRPYLEPAKKQRQHHRHREHMNFHRDLPAVLSLHFHFVLAASLRLRSACAK